MLLYRFEALGLLPDKDTYCCYVRLSSDSFRKRMLSLCELFAILPDDAPGMELCRVASKRYGPLVKVQTSKGQRLYLKVDAKKLRKFEKETGKLVHEKARTVAA